MTIGLALLDAASNCENGAVAVITLRGSGVQFEGKLDRQSLPAAVHLRLDGGGWVTIDREEVAAVESKH